VQLTARTHFWPSLQLDRPSYAPASCIMAFTRNVLPIFNSKYFQVLTTTHLFTPEGWKAELALAPGYYSTDILVGLDLRHDYASVVVVVIIAVADGVTVVSVAVVVATAVCSTNQAINNKCDVVYDADAATCLQARYRTSGCTDSSSSR